MAPLLIADPDSRGVFRKILSTISSLLKSKPSSPSIFLTSPEGIDGIDSNDWGIFSLPPPYSPIAPSKAPARSKLKPPGPEKDP